MKGNVHWMIRALKGALKLGFLLIEAGFAANKPTKPKYNMHEAQELYDDGLIGVSEYVDCLHKD